MDDIIIVFLCQCVVDPLLGCSAWEEIPEGSALRVTFKTKPECCRKQKGSENMIEPSRIGTPFRQCPQNPITKYFRRLPTRSPAGADLRACVTSLRDIGSRPN